MGGQHALVGFHLPCGFNHTWICSRNLPNDFWSPQGCGEQPGQFQGDLLGHQVWSHWLHHWWTFAIAKFNPCSHSIIRVLHMGWEVLWCHFGLLQSHRKPMCGLWRNMVHRLLASLDHCSSNDGVITRV